MALSLKQASETWDPTMGIGLPMEMRAEAAPSGGLSAPRENRLQGIRDPRRHLARGTLTNGAFDVGLLALSAVRGLAMAAFVTRADYGLWGLIGLTMWTALGLKTQFGAGEKYIQQSEDDQELAFKRAFTMEVLFAAAAACIAAIVVVVVEHVTGNGRVLLPSLLLLLLLPSAALQFPIAVFYRRMHFRRQRSLSVVDPVVAAVVAIGLAAAGAGYWSFVVGALCGSWSQALVAVRVSPYRLGWSYDRATLRQYVGFSGPLLIMGVSVLALFYVIYLVGSQAVGLAGIGAFTLVGNLVQFTDQADSIITGTLYPAVCAVQDRTKLLSEIFVKSNRLSLMWAVPFGVGMALFAPDLVRFMFGSRWRPAIPVLEIMGLVTAVHHVGYNWGAFVKARGKTWPIAVSAVITTSLTIAAGIPLMYSHGVVGLAWAFVVGEAAGFTIRGIWLTKFFAGTRIITQLLRGFAPVAVAAGLVLLGRRTLGSEHSAPAAIGVFVVYIAVSAGSTWLLERPLLREALGYLAQRRVQPA